MKYYLNNLRKSIDKRSYFYFISIMLMAGVFLPLVYNNVRFITNNIGWSAVWFFSLTVFKPQVFRDKVLLTVLIYTLVVVFVMLNTLWLNVEEWNKGQITEECFQILIAVSVITYYRVEQDYKHLAKLVKWTFAFILITSVMTIVTSLIDPLFVRQLLNISSVKIGSRAEAILSYKKYGGGNYSFATAIVCLFPVLMYYYRNNLKSLMGKKYILLFVFILFIAVLRMQIFANILISVIIVTMSLLGSKYAVRGYIVSAILIIIFLLIPVQFYASILTSLSSLFPDGSEVNFKLNQTAQFVLGHYQSSDLTTRAVRYPLLLNSFMADPFLGHFVSSSSTADISQGYHLYWMNKLAVYGLLGTIPFLLIFYKIIKRSFDCFDQEFGYYFILSVLSIILLGMMKAIAGWQTWFSFLIVVPGFYYVQVLKFTRESSPSEISKQESSGESHSSMTTSYLYMVQS